MRLRCMCLALHAPTDLRLDERDAGEIGPGQGLVQVGVGGICGSMKVLIDFGAAA
jgi:L-idonate 5-dehydrogenase